MACTRAGRLQLVYHGCEPGNNAVCEEWVCRATGLVAYFLRSKTVIRSRVEIRFPYQQPTFDKGKQVYPRSSFWNSANDLRSQVGSGQRLVCCDCAGKRPCPNGYGRIEQDDGENHQPPAGKAGGVPCVRGRSGKYGRVEPRGREEVQQRPESLAVQPPTVTAAASRCMQPDPSAGTQLRRPWETSRPERSDDATRSKMGEARTEERGIISKTKARQLCVMAKVPRWV